MEEASSSCSPFASVGSVLSAIVVFYWRSAYRGRKGHDMPVLAGKLVDMGHYDLRIDPSPQHVCHPSAGDQHPPPDLIRGRFHLW